MQRSSVNKVILVGYLGQDPEGRFTPQGTAVTNLSVATKESWKNQSGELQERTEWHNVVIFGKMAETASQYMTKGQLVYVEGRLKTDEWDDKESGAKRRATKVWKLQNGFQLPEKSTEKTTMNRKNYLKTEKLPLSLRV